MRILKAASRTRAKFTKANLAIGLVIFGLAGVGVFGFTPRELTLESQSGSVALTEPNVLPEQVKHVPAPEPMYAIYMSQCVAGTPSFRNELVELIDSTKLNSVVIDIKDYSGTIGIPVKDVHLKEASLQTCGAYDVKEFIETLHDKGIYVIGRITVFQDPYYAKNHPHEAVQSVSRPGEPWKDYKGLSFVDVSSRPYWDYVATLSKEAYAMGFDELNYDYIRYPSDGNMKDAEYVNPNKAEALEKFFAYLNQEVKQTGVMMSADLFGYTTVLSDDLGIGQQLERTLPYFDYIAPMVYPSHYNKGFAGLTNPNSDPYAVVHKSMTEAARSTKSNSTPIPTLASSAIMRTETIVVDGATTTREVATGLYTKESYTRLKLRPWLQDFDYGKEYSPEDIAAQIQATYDAGLTSWFFWDPANKYSSLRVYLMNLEQETAGTVNAPLH